MRILVSNAYRGNKRRAAYRQRVRELRPAALVACEADQLGAIKGYRRCAAPAHMPREPRSVAVYVRNGFRVTGVAAYRLSEAVPGAQYADDRWVVETRIERGAVKVALFSIHLNPGARSRPRVAQANRAYVVQLDRLMDAAEAGGYAAIAAGDWNRTASESGMGTPSWLARRFPGSSIAMHRIDGVVTTMSTTATVARVIDMPGSNHKGVMIKLKKRRR